MSSNLFESPLSSRYAGKRMLELFSSDHKYKLWRQLWLALAEAQKDLGLDISECQIKELKSHLNDLNYKKVAAYEKKFRHDVMAHIHAYGDQCPKAKSILHLGATSCYVTDNGDLIQYREALQELLPKLTLILQNFSQLADQYKDLPCLGYTHFQSAQPTTIGKRICLWLQNFLMDAKSLKECIATLPFLGIKGATGTQASLLALFQNDPMLVKKCDQKIAAHFNFKHLLTISGQTYPRKIDTQITHLLSQISISANKFATDLRLLSHTGEIEEPTVENQIGSSAMPYKKNPIYAERICSLSRFIKNLAHNTEDTAAHQWLERSLDDSANRRMVLPECFLACDALLKIILSLSSNLVINKSRINQHLKKELPFLATENILMAGVQKGVSRQKLHETLRVHSNEVRNKLNKDNSDNDLFKKLAEDSSFPLSEKELKETLNIKNFTGLAHLQVDEFLKKEVTPFITSTPFKESVQEELNL